MTDIDIIDSDPARLAARTLVGHIRAETYRDTVHPLFGPYTWIWEQEQAEEAIMAYAKQWGKHGR